MEDRFDVLCDFHFTTIGGSVSLSSYVASFVQELSTRGLKYQLHAFGTNLECNLEQLCSLASWVIEFLENQGESRVFLDMRVTARFDREQDIEEKIRAVTDKLGG